MTQGPNEPNPYDPTGAQGNQPPEGEYPSYNAPPPPPPPGQAPYGATPYGPPPVGPMGGQMGQPGAPYGLHPMTGIPYSDKTKLVAGLLQILIPLGIGRFYIGDTKIGVFQLLVTILTCGIGALWPFIDGIILLVTDSKDANGYMLR